MTATIDAPSVSGRSEPRPAAPDQPCDVRFYGDRMSMQSIIHGRPGLVAVCEPCGWSVCLEGGHTEAELAKLARQHRGEEEEE